MIELNVDQLKIQSASSALDRLQQRWKALDSGAELAADILVNARHQEVAKELLAFNHSEFK